MFRRPDSDDEDGYYPRGGGSSSFGGGGSKKDALNRQLGEFKKDVSDFTNFNQTNYSVRFIH